MLVPAAASDFEVSLLVLGGMLVAGAPVSGIARRSFRSLTALFVLTGFVLGDGGLDILHFSARSEFVGDLATVALIVILFRDGLEVEAELLQQPFQKSLFALGSSTSRR
jgi:sodium/hydrogen antiporter